MRLALLASVLTGCTLLAQAPAARPEFEVASIKPAPPPEGNRIMMGTRGGPGTPDPGRFTADNMSLANLVMLAYDIKAFQLTSPDWMSNERFNIAAKVPEGATKDEFRLMLQNLLAERFKLAVHHEKKEMPLYELSVAKGGPKLQAADANAPDPLDPKGAGPALPDPGREPKRPEIGKDGFPVMAPGRGGAVMMMMMNGRTRMQMPNTTLDQMAAQLGNQLGRPVTNATGLTGKYDMVLTFVRDATMPIGGPKGMMPGPMPGPMVAAGPGPGPMAGPEPGPAQAGASDGDSGPTLFTALQEQLGLKMEQKKGPVDIVVVDRAEKVPTDN